MCGIAAIFNYRTGEPVSPAELTVIRDAMTARGPDGSGNWVSDDGRVGLGHRRLAIIDLSPTGAQPMLSHDRSLVVTFNGEIYNYRELRSQLEAKGCRFTSQSDTEVLLHLYQLEGQGMLDKLRGMYAFAIWDARKNGLFVARDPFGIKPLYYADDGKTLRVASQVKALLAGGHIDTAPEPAGHVGFFLWGHVPAPFTLYKGIAGLPAGHCLWAPRDGSPQLRPFCSIPEILTHAERESRNTEHASHSALRTLHSALSNSVRHHLIADVPVGVFLSSGIDSTALTALASQTSSSLRTVTLGFEEFRGSLNDETPLAAQVAAQFGARHQTIWVSKNDFRDSFPRLMHAMDQPTCDGVNSFFISHAAARAGLKVALSGLGGDELFASYPSFRDIPRSVRLLRPFNDSTVQRFNDSTIQQSINPFIQSFGRAFRIVSAPLLKRLTSPKYAGLFEYGATYGGAYLLRRGMFMPWELPSLLDPDLVREGWERLQTLVRLEATVKDLASPRLRVSALEMTWYMRHQLLRDTDWASMDHSLEVRTPFVDVQLLRDLAPLLAGDTAPTKRDLALAAWQNGEGRTENENPSPFSVLLSSLLTRQKTGFVVPVRQWLLSDPSAFSVLPSPGTSDRGLRGWSRLVYAHQWKSGEGRTKNAECVRSPRNRITEAPKHRSTFLPSAFSVLPSPTSTRRVLVFRIGQLGDTLVALPAMWAIRNHFKDAELTLLCDRHPNTSYVFGPDLLRGSGLFESFDFYPVRAPRSSVTPQSALRTPHLSPPTLDTRHSTLSLLKSGRAMLTLLARLKRQKFDTLVYLSPSARSGRQITRDIRFFRLAGIRNFIGTEGFAELPTRTPGQPLEPTPSEAELLLARLAASGIPVPPSGEGCMDLHLGPTEQSEFNSWLAKRSEECRPKNGEFSLASGSSETEPPNHRSTEAPFSLLPSPFSRFVAFAPGSKMPAKRWPLDRFAQVGQSLIDGFDIWPIVLGGAEDCADGERLVASWGRGFNAAGELSLRASAFALKQCLFYVGNDTGTMHLAASVGTRCVAIFSAREWRGMWYPYGPDHHVLRAAIDCEGCGLVECLDRKNECLTRITVADVLATCEPLLDRSSRREEAPNLYPLKILLESPATVQMSPARAPSTRSHNWLRRLLWSGLALCVLASALYILRAPLLRGAASAWIVNDPPQHADAILVLGGGLQTRPFAAARLYREGYAPRILIACPNPSPTDELALTTREKDVARQVLLKEGVPETAITELGNDVRNMYDESLALTRWVEKTRAKLVIIPTDLFHTRRVRWLFRKQLKHIGVQITVEAVPEREYTAADWWRHEEGLIAFQNEIIKSAYYHLKY